MINLNDVLVNDAIALKFNKPVVDGRCPDCGFGLEDDFCPHCGFGISTGRTKALIPLFDDNGLIIDWEMQDTFENTFDFVAQKLGL